MHTITSFKSLRAFLEDFLPFVRKRRLLNKNLFSTSEIKENCDRFHGITIKVQVSKKLFS